VNCNDLISLNDVKKIYTFSILGSDLTKVKPCIKKERCIDSRCPDKGTEHTPSAIQNSKEIWIDLYAENIPTLLQHCCIVNEYCFSSIGQKVVIIQGITLDERFRGDGILYTMLKRQKQFYRKESFSRIILTATNSGLIVWYRLGFKYAQKRDELKIIKSLNEYLQEIHGERQRYKSIMDVSSKLLYGNSQKEDFTDWLIRHNIDHIKMIMEL